MFIRRRGKSHQLVESYRENGRVRQRVLANLGKHPTIEEALHAWRRSVAEWERILTRLEAGAPRSPDPAWSKAMLEAKREEVAAYLEKYGRKMRARLAHERTNLAKLEAVVAKREAIPEPIL